MNQINDEQRRMIFMEFKRIAQSISTNLANIVQNDMSDGSLEEFKEAMLTFGEMKSKIIHEMNVNTNRVYQFYGVKINDLQKEKYSKLMGITFSG